MEAGRWRLVGNWLERAGMPIPIQGKTIIAWNQGDWFTMVTKLVFVGSQALPATPSEITLQYRGRLAAGERQYTFLLQHSQLGKIEGEGWVAPASIVQRYWVLGDRDRRSGFETIHRLTANQYYLSSGMMAGHYLINTMEATLDRQLN